MTKIIEAATLDDALRALTETVARSEARGETTLVFCEDRLTLLAERAVVDANGATLLTEVTTFRRFLKRTGERSTIGKHGSVLATAALLEKNREKLGCFKRNAAQAVYETLAQLSASRVTAELLESSAEEVEGLLKRKLGDLALLLGEYDGFLKSNGLLDENGYLALLPARIEALSPRNIVFFAFPSFTRQAQACIRAAISRHTVTGILLGGQAPFYTPEATRAFVRAAEEFAPPLVERRPLTLTGDARRMHECLYASPCPHDKIATTHVRIWAPRDETEEMNTIAACIRKLTAEGRRYRDIAVLVGGQEYFLAVRRAFEAYRIPYYADVKRKFSEHPFCIFVLSLLSAAADGLLPDEADAVLASVYMGESGAFRNYLRRYGAFRGGALKEIREEEGAEYGDPDLLRACRERMKRVYGLFRGKGRRAKGREYTAAIRALWDAVDGERVTAQVKGRLPEEERAFLDISRLEPLLEETDRVVGEEVYEAREFAAILKSGMDALTVSVLPRRADAVFVGDITESRLESVPVLFCAGLTEELPRVSQDTAVISDGEIRVLGRLQVELDPEIAVVNARAKEAFALNLCAFREDIYLSCPVRKGGAETARSEVYYYLEHAFDAAPMPAVYPFDRCEYAPALLAFFADLDAAGEGAERIARFSSVRQVLMDPPRPDWPKGDPERLRLLREKGDSAGAGALWESKKLYPTHLESYFECPYKGFALKALGVKENEEHTLLDGPDTGNFLHDVLQHVGDSFNALTAEEEVQKLAAGTARSLIAEPRYAAALDTKAGSYAAERLVEDAVTVAVAAWQQLKGSQFAVLETEKQVSLPALGLAGKADRVDGAGGLRRVIDYKSGTIDGDPLSYYTGRKLQLPLYLRAETAEEGLAPAGAFYFPAAVTFLGEKPEERFRMTGFFCSDPEVEYSLDTTRKQHVNKDGETVVSKSNFFKNGASYGLPHEQFEGFLDYGELVTQQAKREMGSGNIAPSPYANACAFCKLKGMCGFVGDGREEPPISAKEIADIAMQERAGDADGKEEGNA